MNNCYGNKKPSEVIKKYDKVNGKIVVTYLDDTKCEMPLTDQNEKNVQNEMLNQAEEMVNEYTKSSLRIATECVASNFICSYAVLFAVYGIATNSFDNGIEAAVGTCCTIGVDIVSILGTKFFFKEKQKEKKEAQKYKMYLYYRDGIEDNIDNPNLFRGVKNKEKELNINTLDNYSLEDLKTIKSNLKRCQTLEPDAYNQKILLKK